MFNRRFFLPVLLIFIFVSLIGFSSISSVAGTCGHCDDIEEMVVFIYDLSIEAQIMFEHDEIGISELDGPVIRPRTDDMETIFLQGTIEGRGPLSQPGESFGIPNMLVDVEIVGPDGKHRRFSSPIYTNIKGSFNAEIKIGKDSPIGEYTVHINVQGEEKILKFYVIEFNYDAFFMTNGLDGDLRTSIYIDGEPKGELKDGDEINIEMIFGTALKASVDEFVIGDSIHWCKDYQKEISEGGTFIFEYIPVNVLIVNIDTAGLSLDPEIPSWMRSAIKDDLEFITEDDCEVCADLEERIAELEATTARKPDDECEVCSDLEERIAELEATTVRKPDDEMFYWSDTEPVYEGQATETIQIDPETQIRFESWSYYSFSEEGDRFTSDNSKINIKLIDSGELTLFYYPFYRVEIVSNVESVGYSGYHRAGSEVPLTIPHDFFTHDPFGFLGEKKLSNLIVLEDEARSLFGPEWLDSPKDLGRFTSNPELEDFKDEGYMTESGEEYLHYVDKPVTIVAEYTDDYTKLMIIMGIVAVGILGIGVLLYKRRSEFRIKSKIKF